MPASPLFNVLDYGATGSGTSLDTSAINAAIGAAAAAIGGGTVYFPAGTYLSFSIHLASNVSLYLAAGCTLLAADSPLPKHKTGELGGTYDDAEPFPGTPHQDYAHSHWHDSLIWGEGLKNVGISGPGLIHGKGLAVQSVQPWILPV